MHICHPIHPEQNQLSILMAFETSLCFIIFAVLINFSIQRPYFIPKVPCFFIFGDSFFDSGNNNNLVTVLKANYPPYGIDFPVGPTGRFTNGRTPVDFIAQYLGFDEYIPPFARAEGEEIIKGVNYASGGAGIRNETSYHLGQRISLSYQLLNHKTTVRRLVDLLGSQSSANEHLRKCLYAVNIGSNDYVNNYLLPQYYNTSKIYTPEEYAIVLTRQYYEHMKTLYRYGARKVALFGLPPLGCLPGEIQAYNVPGCVQWINAMTQEFNHRLKALVHSLSWDLHLLGAKFIFINTYGIFTTNPSAIGFGYTNRPCCNVSTPGLCTPGDLPCGLRYFYEFWDDYHPTDIMNLYISLRSFTPILPSDAYPTGILRLVQHA